MKYEEFIKLNKRFRIICEWDNTLSECNPDSAFIYCDEGKGQIYLLNEKTMRFIYFTSTSSFKDEMDKRKIPCDWYRLNGEQILDFDVKYFEKAIDIFRPKPSPKNSVPVTSIKNHNLFLRIMRNCDLNYYSKILEKNIAKNRK